VRSEGAARAERRVTRARRARRAFMRVVLAAAVEQGRSRAVVVFSSSSPLVLSVTLPLRARRSLAPPARRRGARHTTSRRADARDARGALGVPARCALAVRSPRSFCASLFSSPRSARAAPSLRYPPRRRQHHRDRPCGARDVRRATRAARGESAGIPLSFVVVRSPRGCFSGLCSAGLLRCCVVPRASFALLSRVARPGGAAREARARGVCG
jgi:hypothetical protein